MISAIKAEFRKLFTVRSTYIILLISLGLEFLFAFYATGWKAQPLDLASRNYVSSQVTSALVPLTLIAGLVAVLLISHEYRYNTIMYTLTSNKSRITVFISKIVAISCFAIVFSLLFGFLSPVLGYAGIKLHGHNLAAQYIPIWSLIWRSIFYGWGFAMLAAILSFIIRVQVGAITAFLLIPIIAENLIGGLLLKANQVYLPFSSLSVLLGESMSPGHIPYSRAAFVATTYIVVGWIMAGVLFVKRDAN